LAAGLKIDSQGKIGKSRKQLSLYSGLYFVKALVEFPEFFLYKLSQALMMRVYMMLVQRTIVMLMW